MSEWIRVSCATLCRIEHVGRYLLLLNLNRRKKGLYILAPIGGALALHDATLGERFGAVPENPDVQELRFALPRGSVPAFRDWFYSGEGRELSPFRELYEELVLESGLLPALTEDDATCEYLWTVEEKAPTARQGQTGLLTYYFLEIYDIRFKSARTLGPLLAAPPESGAVWVTAQQIAERSTIPLHIDGGEHEARVNGTLLLPFPQVYPSDNEL